MGRGGGTSEETIKAIQEDAAAGMSYNQIAEKEGVSWPTVKRYAQNGQKSAGGAKKEKPQRRGGVFGKAGQGSYSVELSAAGLDAVWNGLTPEKKAELLRGL